MASNIDRSRKLFLVADHRNIQFEVDERREESFGSATHVAIDQSLREGRADHVHVNRRRSCRNASRMHVVASGARGSPGAPIHTGSKVTARCASRAPSKYSRRYRPAVVSRGTVIWKRVDTTSPCTPAGSSTKSGSTDHPSAVTICRRSVRDRWSTWRCTAALTSIVRRVASTGRKIRRICGRTGGEHGERKLSIAAREPLRPRGRTLDRQSLSGKNDVALQNDWRRVERLTGESLICHLIPVSVVCLPQPEWRRHRSIDRHHDVVVHMLHRLVCRDWRDLPSVWRAEAEATCVDADVERIQQPSMDAHLFAGGDMRTLGNAFDIQSKTSEDRVFKAGNLVIELATECLDVIDLYAIDEVSPALRRADPRPPSGYPDESATGPHRPW